MARKGDAASPYGKQEEEEGALALGPPGAAFNPRGSQGAALD